MKARGAAIQGGLAAVALVAAYFGWQREPTRAPDEVIALEARPSEVQSVRFDDGKKWVVLDRREDSVWITHGTHPPPATPVVTSTDGGTPDGGASLPDARTLVPDAGTPAKVAAVPVTREVRGNETAEKLLERFAPLRANRALGKLETDKLRELGLTASPRFLDVTLRSGTQRFHVSAVSPSGGAPYVQSEKNGQVYLVSATLISDLDAASTRLVDRRFHVFKQPDYDQVLLRAGDKERLFLQTGSPPDLKVSAQATPATADEFAKNWLDKVYRLVPTELLGKGEAPTAGEPKVEARLEYRKDGKPLGHAELARGADNLLYLRTEHSAGWVRVQLGAKEVLDDAVRLAGSR
ncbi:MAG: DUF4340 domain-containing protein [Myxococcota bacterium]|nr:DUF4340 domain-containing protein [Myxococcota bacterium]